jgi:DNA-binding transcriptional LysR family regulator
LPLVMLEAPPGFPTMRFYQLWHERAHHSPAHRWLRALIADVGRGHRTPAA